MSVPALSVQSGDASSIGKGESESAPHLHRSAATISLCFPTYYGILAIQVDIQSFAFNVLYR